MISFKPPPPLPAGYQVSVRNLFGITFLSILIFVVLGVIVVQLDPTIFGPERDRAEALLWFALLLTIGVLTATGYVLAWRTPARWGIIGLTRPEPRWILIAVAVGVILFFLGERADAAFGLGMMSGFRAEFGPALGTQTGLISVIAARVVLLPLTLEIYFRGILFNFFSGRFGLEAGLFVSSILFAGLYYNPDLPVAMAYGLVHGAVYALMFQRAGTLWAPIAAHGTLWALIIAKAAWV